VGCASAQGDNRWHRLPDGIFVARLARSEFLVEEVGGASAIVEAANHQLQLPTRAAGVYPVVRQDYVVELSGPQLDDWLRQICNVNFEPVIAASSAWAGPVILTSVIGISVVAIVRSDGSSPAVRFWIDPSFAHYFWATLLDVAIALGSGVEVVKQGREQREST
jgi:sarcosine oxidase gamma subunit